MTKPPLMVQGHHGLGDNLHQRGIIRELMKTHEVWLETSWASLYHDLIQDGLHLLRRPVRLRTQAKNAARPSENELFQKSAKPVPRGTERKRLSYHGRITSQTGSGTILEAMAASVGLPLNDTVADFSLPIPEEWFKGVAELPLPDNKPVLVYRPPVVRPEWRGNETRNPDGIAYAQLFSAIRAGFFVVSVADLEIRREWQVGPMLKHADLEFHKGELPFETLAALFAYADMVYTPSGFAAIMAQAVGTPVISVIGGYERAQWHNNIPDLYCGIEPATPCACSTSLCRRVCDKRIDMKRAEAKIIQFVLDLGLPVARANLSDLYMEPMQQERTGLKA